jgi:catechol 2,3-dioxygenase-like lactoylglutathione lyase family enzyme
MNPLSLKLDHCVIAVSDPERSDAFYRDVLGAEVIKLGAEYRVYRIGDRQLSVHTPGLEKDPASAKFLIRALDPVRPGNSDICFEWPGAMADAAAHLAKWNVAIEVGPRESFGAQGKGDSVYFRDPDGTLLEFIVYA